MLISYLILLFSVPASVALDCSKAVSMDAGIDNIKCQDLCKSGDVATFNDSCQEVTATLNSNGQMVASGGCFDNWVYGYSEPDELKGYKIINDVEGPAECQTLCQQDDDCVGFLWSGETLIWGMYDHYKRCALKSLSMMQGAANQVISADGGSIDTSICNSEMSMVCIGLDQCLECDGTIRCVWRSQNHLGGFRHCGMENVSCSPDFPHVTTTTTTTTPTTTTTTTTTTTEPTTTTTTTTTTPTTTPTTTTTTTTTTPTTTPTTTTTTTTTTPTTTPTTTTTTAPTTTTTTTPTTTTTTTPTTTTTTTPITTTSTTTPTTTTTTTPITTTTTTPTTTTTTTPTTTTTTTPTTTTTTTPTTTTTTTPTTTTTTTPITTTSTTTPTTTMPTTTKPTTATLTVPTTTTTAPTTAAPNNGTKNTIIGVASASAGLAALGGLAKYFSGRTPDIAAEFDAGGADNISDSPVRETADTVTEEMYA